MYDPSCFCYIWIILDTPFTILFIIYLTIKNRIATLWWADLNWCRAYAIYYIDGAGGILPERRAVVVGHVVRVHAQLLQRLPRPGVLAHGVTLNLGGKPEQSPLYSPSLVELQGCGSSRSRSNLIKLQHHKVVIAQYLLADQKQVIWKNRSRSELL